MLTRSGRPDIRSKAMLTLAVLACCAGFSTNAKACGELRGAGQAIVLPATSQFQTSGLIRPSSPSRTAKGDGKVSIVGLWTATFTSGGQVFDQGFDQWHSDGTEILNDIAPPQPANGAGTVCLGVYKQTGPRTYKLRHPFWSFDSTATLVGSGVILENVTVDPSGVTYSGSFTFFLYDLSGNLIFEADGTIQAQRMTAD